MAKKATRKQSRKHTASKKKAAVKRAPKKKVSARKKAAPKVARKKVAARAAATRKRTAQPAPEKPSTVKSAATLAKGVLAGAVTAVTSRLPGGKGALDAIQLLEQEHRRFEALLKQGEESTERARKGRRELLSTLTSELNAHELMEEKFLYPALESHPEAKEIVLEGYAEHHVADLIVAELHEVATDDEQWGAKFKVLKENIEHHIQEEEGEMFRLARGIFSRAELLDLADRMRALKPGR